MAETGGTGTGTRTGTRTEAAGAGTEAAGAGTEAAGAGTGAAARVAVGAYGERCAVRHLTGAGLRVVARNWRCAQGEIDIVAWDGETLVFCEVKTRRGSLFGTPEEAVAGAKARRLRRLAARWLAAHRAGPREIRFDVVAVRVPPRGAARIDHIRGAF